MFTAYRRAATILVGIVGILSCQPPTSERSELVARLVKRGDEFKVKNKEVARSAYLFALQFAPNDEAVQAKVNALGHRVYNMFADGGAGVAKMSAAGSIVENLNDFQAFPKSTERSDLVNLRMLNDENLVGNLNYAEMQGCLIFISNPATDLSALRAKYGATDSERTMKNGGQVLTYARFRFFGDATGKVLLVIYKPDAPPSR